MTWFRRILSRFTPRHSVRDYGAMADGITDDTAAFEAAGLAGGIVIVPPGEYMLSSSLPVAGGDAEE